MSHKKILALPPQPDSAFTSFFHFQFPDLYNLVFSRPFLPGSFFPRPRSTFPVTKFSEPNLPASPKDQFSSSQKSGSYPRLPFTPLFLLRKRANSAVVTPSMTPLVKQLTHTAMTASLGSACKTLLDIPESTASELATTSTQRLKEVLVTMSPLQQDLFAAFWDSLLSQGLTVSKTLMQTGNATSVPELLNWFKEKPSRIATGYVPFAGNYFINVGLASILRQEMIKQGITPTCSALLSGMVAGAVLTPLEYMSTLKQSSKTPESIRYTGLLKQLWERSNLLNLRRGALAAGGRDTVYFGAMQGLKSLMGDQDPFYVTLFKSFTFGFGAGAATNVFDGLRANVQCVDPNKPYSYRHVLQQVSLRDLFLKGAVARGFAIGTSLSVVLSVEYGLKYLRGTGNPPKSGGGAGSLSQGSQQQPRPRAYSISPPPAHSFSALTRMASILEHPFSIPPYIFESPI